MVVIRYPRSGEQFGVHKIEAVFVETFPAAKHGGQELIVSTRNFMKLYGTISSRTEAKKMDFFFEGLFISQSIDGVQQCRFSRWIKAEKYPDRNRKSEGKNNREWRDDRRPLRNARYNR